MQKSDGSIEWFKAHLVALGFTQMSGLDFKETYSPAIWHTTIHLVISLSTSFNWSMRQLDLRNTFLYGKLKEIVYMEQPPSFIDKYNPDYIFLLHKSLYRLKWAPQAWFDRLSQFLLHFGFYYSKVDSSLFIYRQNSLTILLFVYVDDISMTGNNDLFNSELIHKLSLEFSIKDLGSLSFF